MNTRIPLWAGVLFTLAAPRVAAGDQVRLYAGMLVVEPESQCTGLWNPWTTSWFILENQGAFEPGDTVTVSSSGHGLVQCGGQTFDYLPQNTISAWRASDFGCGTLTVDPEYGCQGMWSATYGFISIVGITGFHDGDAIRLRANLFLERCEAIPECVGNYCVTEPKAEDCPLPTEEVTWGHLKVIYSQGDGHRGLTTP